MHKAPAVDMLESERHKMIKRTKIERVKFEAQRQTITLKELKDFLEECAGFPSDSKVFIDVRTTCVSDLYASDTTTLSIEVTKTSE